MHELAVCNELIRQAVSVADSRHARRIVEINVQIGPLSGVEPELLRQAFTIASAGTAAAGARLVLDGMPVRVHCSQCGNTTDATPSRLLCADCGSWQTRLVSGDDLLMTTIELEGKSETDSVPRAH